MAEADTTIDTTPIPRRFWWLKRLSIALFLFGCLLVGLRYATLAVVKRRLEAEIAAIRASGEPLTAVDFLEKPVPAEEDAGPDLLAAGTTFVVPRQHLTAWNNLYSIATRYSPQDAATIEAVLGANQAPLAKVRSARGKRIANLTLALKASNVPYQRLWELRQVNDALALAARKAHADGRDGEAVEYLRDGIAMSRALASQPVMITQLVANGMEGGTVRVAKTIAPTMRTGAGVGSASDAQIRELISDLLQDREGPRSGRKWAWQKEREMQMDLIYALADDDQGKYLGMKLRTSRFAIWWMRPIEVSNAHDLLVMANTYVAAAGAADAAEALQIWKEWEIHSLRNPDLGKLGSPVIGNLDSQYLAVFYRREAAVALAARMFQLKYGRDAKTADELVPEFLSEASLDPLFGNGVKMPVHPTSQPARR